jgi:hypothetical protein
LFSKGSKGINSYSEELGYNPELLKSPEYELYFEKNFKEKNIQNEKSRYEKNQKSSHSCPVFGTRFLPQTKAMPKEMLQ